MEDKKVSKKLTASKAEELTRLEGVLKYKYTVAPEAKSSFLSELNKNKSITQRRS